MAVFQELSTPTLLLLRLHHQTQLAERAPQGLCSRTPEHGFPSGVDLGEAEVLLANDHDGVGTGMECFREALLRAPESALDVGTFGNLLLKLDDGGRQLLSTFLDARFETGMRTAELPLNTFLIVDIGT